MRLRVAEKIIDKVSDEREVRETTKRRAFRRYRRWVNLQTKEPR